MRGVRQEEEGEGAHDQRREALDEEQDFPVRDRGMAGGDAVGEGAGEAGGEGRGGEEDAGAESELVAEVEEGEEVGDAGPVAGFEDAEEEA